MSMAFLGEIRLFSGTFAPRNWAFCNGQILQVTQNQALYSLIGNTYGGSPPNTFALPDLRGRLPVHAQPGSAMYTITGVTGGQTGGGVEATITIPLPAHTHTATFTGTGGSPEVPNTLGVNVSVQSANTSTGTVANPESNIPAVIKSGMSSLNAYVAPASATGTLGGVTAQLTGDPGHPATGFTGGTVTIAAAGTTNQPTATVIPPSLGMNYIICVAGLYPIRP